MMRHAPPRSPHLAGFFLAVCFLIGCLPGCGGGGSPTSVHILGDSISTGYGMTTSITERVRQTGFEVIDGAVNGQTLHAVAADPLQGDVVVVALGINDAAVGTADQYRDDLRSIAARAKAEGRALVITGLVGLPASQYITPEIVARRDAMDAISHEVAAEFDAIHAGWGELYTGPQDLADAVHRTQNASDALAEALVKAIKKATE